MIPNSNSKSQRGVSDSDLVNIRQNLKILASQLKSGRLDTAFLERQIGKVGDLFDRLEAERLQGQKAGQFEALYNVSRVLGSSLELQTVLDQVMDAIIQLTGAERGFLMLQDYDGQLTVKAARNIDQQTLGNDEFKYSRTVANQVLDSGKPILTTNAAEDPRFAGQASIIAQSLRSIMAIPLRARGNVIGVAYVDSSALAGLFKPTDLVALDALSGQAAVAIDNALLFSATDQELAARLEELRQLRRIDLLLSETLDADKAMSYTLEWACRLGDAARGHLGLIKENPREIPASHHYGEVWHSHSRLLNEAYPQVWEVVEQGKHQVYREETSEGVQTILIVPIRREQKVIGVVILERSEDRAFTIEQEDLVVRVVARAAISIENARLYAAVRAADKAKSEFVGIVAHDLKAPMNGIGGYAALLLMQGNLSERQEDYLRKIKDTVHRMDVLVSDLADISRIESGHFFMEQTRVPVEHVIQSVRDATMPQITEREHTFCEEIEPGLPEMSVDYYRLVQVLTNLVSNAYKYTPNGGKITLKAALNGERILFTISDTGIGLSEDSVKKLGTKFWRSEDSYTRSQPGTGLGFAITRSLIEQMGSHVTIQSKVGEGSTFSFSVPVAKEQ